MRLLHTETGQFVEFANPFEVTYAILSHTWDPSGEQTCQELRDIQKRFSSKRTYPRRESIPNLMEEGQLDQMALPLLPKETTILATSRTRLYRLLALVITPLLFLIRWLLRVFRTASIWDHPGLSDKIRRACAIARAHGYHYIWIDFCCIDKTSSSELSEAINSMFSWYRNAAVCYAFLADVPDREEDSERWGRMFRWSNWFRRGWTLQELIAPRAVVFLSQDWHILGSKSTLIKAVESATCIDPAILTHSLPLSSVSVATRMSWAANRRTTRVEDQAYSLLGIFDITMPTLYGEGDRAFLRLQEEILKRIPDQSLFAWGNGCRGFILPGNPGDIQEVKLNSPWPTLFSPLIRSFAVSERTPPRQIAHNAFLNRLGRSDIPIPEYTVTPHGIRTQIPLVPIRALFPGRPGSVVADKEEQSEWDWYLAILACESESDDGSLIAFVCGGEPSSSPPGVLQHGLVSASGGYYHLVVLSPDEIEHCRPHMNLEMVYLSFSASDAVSFFSTILYRPAHNSHSRLHLSGWSKALLRDQGYRVRLLDSDPAAMSNSDDSDSHDLYCAIELVKGADAISIRCRCRNLSNTVACQHISFSVACHDAIPITPDPGSWKTFNDIVFRNDRGGYLIERMRATLKNSAGDTLVVRLGLEHVSKESVHLHVEVVDDGLEVSSGGSGDLQDKEMESDANVHEMLPMYEKELECMYES